MPINTRQDYVEISYAYTPGSPVGTLVEPVLRLPAPKSIPASNEFMVEASRSAAGVLIAQQVGRSQYTTELSWSRLKNDEYWRINRYFDTYGYFFYMRYFSHTEGRIKVQRFYRGNMGKATPSADQEIRNGISVPRFYREVSFSVIDMGEPTTYIESEVVIT